MATRSIPILRRLLRSPASVTPPLVFRHRSITYMPRPGDGGSRTVTLIPGDGIGPLVTDAVQQVFAAMHAPIEFEAFEVHGDMSAVPAGVIDSIKRNKVCLKGGLATPVGGGVSSLNMQLRKELDLYASLVNCFNVPGLPSRHENVDIVVIRENTEGEYSGLEHEVVPGVVESLKVITKFCSERIAKYAFEYAYLNDRKKVTAVHKANIMKLADGLFLESCREIANNYPGIEYNEIIVDNCCMQLVSKPEQFDVMVTPNLYGNLVANTAAGIAGGTGVMPGDTAATASEMIDELIDHPFPSPTPAASEVSSTSGQAASGPTRSEAITTSLTTSSILVTTSPLLLPQTSIADDLVQGSSARKLDFDFPYSAVENLARSLGVPLPTLGQSSGEGGESAQIQYETPLDPALATSIGATNQGNVGQDYAIFEQGASAGNVGNEKLVEKKRANPTALLLSSAMLLRHLQFPSFADRLETAVMQVVEEGKYRTKDLGGKSTTQEVVDAVIAALD